MLKELRQREQQLKNDIATCIRCLEGNGVRQPEFWKERLAHLEKKKENVEDAISQELHRLQTDRTLFLKKEIRKCNVQKEQILNFLGFKALNEASRTAMLEHFNRIVQREYCFAEEMDQMSKKICSGCNVLSQERLKKKLAICETFIHMQDDSETGRVVGHLVDFVHRLYLEDLDE